MIFNKLRLKNFKSHENTVINLEPCVNLIIGENGAGKTTILEAISFVLFKQYTTKKIADLVKTNKNKNPKETMEVSLEFNVDGKDYKIIRKISKLSSNNKITIKSDVKLLIKEGNEYYSITRGDKLVNNEIQTILNMDSELFLNAIYIRQGEIADLIGKTPSEKKKLIAKLLRIDSLEKAWNNILPLINIYENQKSELKGKISSINELKEELGNKKLILNDLSQRSQNYELELKSLEKEKQEYSLKKSNMESEKTVFETLNNNLANETEIIEKLVADKLNFQKQFDDIEKMEKEMLLLLGDVKKLPFYLEFEESVKNIKSLKKDEEFFISKIQSIKDCKEILKNGKTEYEEYIEIQEKLNKLTQEKQKYEIENQLAKKIAKDIEQLESKISKNKKNMDDFFKSVNEQVPVDFDSFKNFNNQLNYDFIDFELLNNHFKDLKEKIQEKIANLNDNISLKNQENSALKESSNNVKKPLKEIKNTDNQCPTCKSEISKDKKEELLNSYKSIIEKNENLINSNNEYIKKSKIEKDILQSKIAIFEKIEYDITFNEYISNEISEDIKKIKELQENIKDNEKIKLNLAEIISSIESLNKLGKIRKNGYDNYIKSLGSLDTLGRESIAQEKLNNITKSIDFEVEKIKQLMEKDSSLKTDMGEDKLKEEINLLKAKDKKYNQLKGSIIQKDTIKSQLLSYEKDLNWRESKIKKIKENIEICKYDEDFYKSILLSYEKIEKKVEELYKNISEIKGKTTEIKSFLTSINKKLDESKEYEKKLDNIDDYLKLLKEIRTLYGKDGIQKDLRNKSKPLIQKNTVKFFEQFNFNYSDLIIDDDYNISVYGPEGETNLDMVSGGEKIAIALALRLGITHSMSSGNLETILLDEPTIHLDKYRRTELIELLMKMSVIPQMIIVTHDSELENAADNIIKVKKENGISEIISG
ncbi:MAG: AAA family ATPase [Methanobrevibacter sp.]|nr:AAA family ATPase [Methanobrevibacter sp.]